MNGKRMPHFGERKLREGEKEGRGRERGGGERGEGERDGLNAH